MRWNSFGYASGEGVSEGGEAGGEGAGVVAAGHETALAVDDEEGG